MIPLSQLDEKVARNFMVILTLAALGAILSVTECYLLWSHGGEPDATIEILKMLVSFLTLWLLLFLFVYYHRKYQQMRASNELLPQDTLWSSGLFVNSRGWSLLPEALLCLVHAPPFVCFEVSVDYYDLRHGKALPTTLNTDEIAAILMLFARSVLLVRWMPYISGLTRTHSRAYANLNHLTLSTWLAVRINVMRFPVRFLGTATTLLVLMLAFTMQATERRVNPNLDHYSNCVWLVLSGMTATGFGDFYPQTPLGRLVSTVAFMWGALMAALTVMTVIRQTELSNSEVRVHNMIERTRSRSRLKQRAAFYVQAAWAAYLERLQRSQSAAATASLLGNEPLHADPKFCRTMRDFRVLRKQSMTPDDLHHRVYKELLDTRTRLDNKMRDVEEKLEEMDAKFEHNIAAMYELLQKNLKYLKHLS